MPDGARELLAEAVARNCALVLSLPSAGMLRHQKSRFLAEAEQGIWIETNSEEFPLIEELLRTKQPAGISFKNGQTKVVFAVPLLAMDRQYRINDETVVPAVMITVPQQIKAIQRRANYRVRVFDGCSLSARVWRIAPRVSLIERPMPTQEIRMTLRDLSTGGMGLIFHGEDGQPPKVSEEDRLRVEISYAENSFLIEGRMRKPTGQQTATSLNTGIQFKEPNSDIESRQKLAQLTRIVGEMQREEVRRARLGIG